MTSAPEPAIRVATADDMPDVARLLHDFNREYDVPTPPPGPLAERLRTVLAGGDMAVLLCGDGPDGLALMRFRAGLWTPGLECYLAELYVVPALRGRGLGRALLEAALDHARERGADHMDLGTSEDDVAARALYERLGFTSREGGPDGPVMYVFERSL